MLYHNHRQEPYFSYLKSGQKTIEGRLRKGKYAKIKVDDTIAVSNIKETEEIIVVVTKVIWYQNFSNLIVAEGLDRLLPNIKTIDKGLEIYRQFYSKEDEKKYGSVAIHVKLI